MDKNLSKMTIEKRNEYARTLIGKLLNVCGNHFEENSCFIHEAHEIMIQSLATVLVKIPRKETKEQLLKYVGDVLNFFHKENNELDKR